ncbi:MAG: stimulus-sensing domain-containing protein [Bdellovibrionales bacterium]
MRGKFDEARLNTWWLRRSRSREGRRTRLSPIVMRILAVNMMALAILVGSLLYLGRYQERIVANELDSLTLQARIIASAIAEGAVVVDESDRNIMSPLLGRLMVKRLAETTETRTRLYDEDDTLLADSRVLLSSSAKAQADRNVEAASEQESWGARLLGAFFNMIDFIHERREYPLYPEDGSQNSTSYEIVKRAMKGDMGTQVWRARQGGLTLAAAVPVQHSRAVLGVVMMSRADANIDKAITSVRYDILKIFLITLLITVLLSLYLARAIARPIRQLAMAAEGLRHGQMKIKGMAGTASLLSGEAIPDMTARQDEIGDLSGALRELTDALARRIGAIENFAADVAHEIKNPLTSLRSAVETVERVSDPVARQKLMFVIRDDVDRLDRLISDISNASRLDAELGRDEVAQIDLGRMLTTLTDTYRRPGDVAASQVALVSLKEPLFVMGIEARLVQVLRNLIDNALSFSPSGASVTVSARRDGKTVFICVEDMGPGIPENKLEDIFERFYSERPKTEKFGTHSGLGLSISRQIVEAHRGTIRAENIKGVDGDVLGARFVVQLPLLR